MRERGLSGKTRPEVDWLKSGYLALAAECRMNPCFGRNMHGCHKKPGTTVPGLKWVVMEARAVAVIGVESNQYEYPTHGSTSVTL